MREQKVLNKVVDSFTQVDFSEMIFPGIVIYDSPTDFDGVFVARIWEMEKAKPTNAIIIRKTLKECQEDIKKIGLTMKIVRCEDDPLSVVETWI